MTIEMSVNGKSCNHCVMSVKEALRGLKGVDSVEVNLSSRRVKIDFDGDDSRREEFKTAIEVAG